MRKTDQEEYSRNTLLSLRLGIQRYLWNPPFNRTVNITRDDAFHQANNILDVRGRARDEQIKKGRVQTAIEVSDLEKMYDSKVLSDDSPQGLQNKVFFEIALHFDGKSLGRFRDLTVDSFEFHQDPENGSKYVTLASDRVKQQRLHATDGPKCPVASLEKYLKRLDPNCPVFFQACIGNADVFGPAKDKQFWYNGKPIGKNNLSLLMKNISIDADLSCSYRNKSIQATAVKFRKGQALETDFKSFFKRFTF